MKYLIPYLRHKQTCDDNSSDDPLTELCNCGLRGLWAQLVYNYENPSTTIVKGD